MYKKVEKYLKCEKWYHGTTLSGWNNICITGVKADYNIGNELDFGYGFYLTPNMSQAKAYILNLLKYDEEIASEIPLSSYSNNKKPVVVEFNFCPNTWYEEGIYRFKFLNAYDDEFANFVFHNRVNNINAELQHKYDLIFGVMSDSLPTILIQRYKNSQITKEEVLEALKKSTSNKQLSLHNQKLCDIIRPTKAILISTGEELKIDGYNTGNRCR